MRPAGRYGGGLLALQPGPRCRCARAPSPGQPTYRRTLVVRCSMGRGEPVPLDQERATRERGPTVRPRAEKPVVSRQIAAFHQGFHPSIPATTATNVARTPRKPARCEELRDEGRTTPYLPGVKLSHLAAGRGSCPALVVQIAGGLLRVTRTSNVRRLPPEQPSDDGPEELLRGAAFAIDVSPLNPAF